MDREEHDSLMAEVKNTIIFLNKDSDKWAASQINTLHKQIDTLHKQVKNLSLLLKKMANRNQRLEDEIKNLSELLNLKERINNNG